ncbi:MAG TPA: hypothetical protein DD400_03425, partial [Rhodospirillaceae bacterium]|nr:hypothetical protein [Rhodospirillaceae bacterium]
AQMIKKVVKEQKLNANWVGEQWPAYNKLVAGPVIAALEQDKPDVIFSVLVGSDLVKFVREARKRGFIKDRIFIFPYLSMPEHYKMIGKEVPKGWLTMGAPYNEQALKKPVLAAFMKRYEAAYHEPIKDYSISGYNGVKVLAAAMTKAGSTDPKKVAAAFDDLRFATPLGEETIRKIDHQATTAFWVGLSDFIDGKPSIRNWTEYNVNDNLPPDAYILKIRNKK